MGSGWKEKGDTIYIKYMQSSFEWQHVTANLNVPEFIKKG